MRSIQLDTVAGVYRSAPISGNVSYCASGYIVIVYKNECLTKIGYVIIENLTECKT